MTSDTTRLKEMLRNQLMHGGASYQSQVNRQQVTDGAHILSFLLPGD